MQQNSANIFSEDDYHLLEVHQLGKPLTIYRLKPVYILLMRVIGQVMVLLASILVVIGVVTFGLVGWHLTMSTLYPLTFVSLGLTFLIMGFAFFYIAVPQVQSERVIVCEDGLLYARKIIKTERVISMYWNDIVAIRKDFLFLEFFLRSREGQVITLTIAFQNIGGLVAHIKQRSEEAGYKREC